MTSPPREQFILDRNSTLKIDNGYCLETINRFNNEILICSNYVNFNGHCKNHDQNGVAYATKLTADERYLLTFIRNPECLQVLKLENGNMCTIRGLSNFKNREILAASMSDEASKNGKASSPKIYLIFEERNVVGIEVIQFSSQVENDPKCKSKVLNDGGMTGRPQFWFSVKTPNMFFVRLADQLKICRAVIRQNQLSFQFAIQQMEPGLSSSFSRRSVVAMSESSEKWALLCTHQQSQMILSIFWQHHQPGKLSKQMYYRDDSYIFSSVIPCDKSQFVKMEHVQQFYLIETYSKKENTHDCWVVSERNMSDPIKISLLPNSYLCFHSLSINDNEIKVREIGSSKSQLFETRIVRKMAKVETESTTLPKNQRVSAQEETVVSTAIVPFREVLEQAAHHSAHSAVVVKNEQIQKAKPLINKSLLEHLSPEKNKISQIVEESDEQDLVVPDQLSSLVSFGIANQSASNPKHQKPITPQPTPITTPTSTTKNSNAPSTAPLSSVTVARKPKQVIKKTQALNQFRAILDDYSQSTLQCKATFKRSYSNNKPLQQILKILEFPTFEKKEEQRFLNESTSKLLYAQARIESSRALAQKIRLSKSKLKDKVESLEEMVQRHYHSSSENEWMQALEDVLCSTNSVKKRRKNERTYEWSILKELGQYSVAVEELQIVCQDITDKYEKMSQNKLRFQQSAEQTNQHTRSKFCFIALSDPKPPKKFTRKIPIPRKYTLNFNKMKPILSLESLHE